MLRERKEIHKRRYYEGFKKFSEDPRQKEIPKNGREKIGFLKKQKARDVGIYTQVIF